jgi:hypothetical protein
MMKYTAQSIAEICNKIIPELVEEYMMPKSRVFLPTLINTAINKIWIDQIPISFEEDIILRRAAKELQNNGFMHFESD